MAETCSKRVSLGLYFSVLGFPPHSCWWKHLLFFCLSTPTLLSLPSGRLSYFYLNASLLAKAMLLCPSSHLHPVEAWPACATDKFHQMHLCPCPYLSEAPATDGPPLGRSCCPISSGRMTQRRHYANLCQRGALQPYCCCCQRTS